jgi:rhomboid protease GluP
VTPWASWTIGLVVALIFALEVFWGGWGVLSGGAATGPTLIRMGANIRERVLAGELDRILSSAFLHIGLLHLVVNLWALRVFGPFLERILGASRFVVLYAVSALAGGLASFAFGRYSFSAGASGALWGLMVGGFALSVWPRGLLPEAVRHQLQTRGWQPLAVNILISFSGNIDRYAHFGGGLAGGALIASGLLSWGVRRRGDPAPEGGALLFRGLAAALAVLMAASVASALARGRPWELRSPPEPLRRVALPGTPVALSVPPGLALEAAAGDSVAGEPEGTRAFVIGDGYSDPLTLWVTVRPGVVPLEALRARLATAAPAELHLQGTPRIVMLDGRPAVTARLEGPELTRTTWILFQSDHVVQLDADCITGAAAAWCRLGERIARSVGAAGP